MKKNIIQQQGAISILFAILLLAELSVIGLGIATLTIKQLRMSGQVGQSVVAYYAAEAGAEKCLYQVRKSTGEGCDNTGQISETVGSGSYQASYTATYSSDTVTSIGQFVSTNRKVELTW